jgi:hypothetical protein
MTARRRIDHRNSRIYRDSSPRPVAPGPMLTIAWLIDTARRAFAGMFGLDRATASQRIVLRSGSKHGYTLLGTAKILPHAVRHSLPANDLSDR